ncbi:hypothetical protein AS203_03220 [Hoylesella enoeca]|uniref:Uncharacterized protein n=1 Tax=Hoylesella enoeca TaxID=76123 RepID=A0A0S2KIT6_9BACT|nr:hypothetical protein AS203_03220 [Hoylesella enoeca]
MADGQKTAKISHRTPTTIENEKEQLGVGVQSMENGERRLSYPYDKQKMRKTARRRGTIDKK